MTVKQLSNLSGVCANAIWYMETDKRNGGIDRIELLADALGISIDEYTGHKVIDRKQTDVERFFGGKKYARS